MIKNKYPSWFVLIILVVFLLITAFTLNGCKSTEAESTEAESIETGVVSETAEEVSSGQDITVAFCSPAQDIEFFKWFCDGVENRGKELGVKTIITDAGYSSEKMLTDVSDVIQMGAQAVSTIILEDALGPAALELCNEAGVPLVASDAPIAGAYYLGADNFYCGTIVGNWLAEWINEHYKSLEELPLIVVLDQPEWQAVKDRADGALTAIWRRVPYLQDFYFEDLRRNANKDIVVNYDHGYTQEDSEKVMADVITANPRDSYIVIAGSDDSNAAGCTLALEAAGKDKNSVVVGQSGSAEVFIKMIADPSTCFYATTSYFPEKQGAALVDAMIAIINGEVFDNEDIKYTEHRLTTKWNVKHQYPQIFEGEQ